MSRFSSIGQLPGRIRVTVIVVLVSAALAGTGCSESGDIDQLEESDSADAGIELGEASDSATTTDILNLSDTEFEVSDWTEESHGNDADPDFTEVFDDTQVKRLDLVVTPERWQIMLDDMTAMYGEFGGGSGQPGGGGTQRPDQAPSTNPIAAPVNDPATVNAPTALPTPPLSADALQDVDEDPIFVPADVYYNGKQWYRVGIRFKGNSTLMGSWQSGILKLSFKMDFDEFEDDYPQIDNQRFYGFKKFSLKNNYQDLSNLREKMAADVFRDAGLAVSHTAFYTLYVDHGNGPEYFGLYTLVEEVDGTVLDTQFTSDDGNLYKPEDGSANFVEGTFSEVDFEKKTNEDDEDWADIIALFEALHADTASTAPDTWRQNLESIFDVNGFLKYLAVNGIIQNWDTYGRMPHNYYLYNNPDNNKLTWIPWDNNEALQEGKQGGALALDFTNLNEAEWPLIAKIYADDVYQARYKDYLIEVMSYAFETSTVQSYYENYKALIAPYATTERIGYSFLNSADDFYVAVEALKEHASGRADAVSTYLYSQ